MELRHLHYFIAIAKFGSITKAAESLHIAQPPLSRQLRSLEEELGVNLFERNKKKKVKLTLQGEFFLKKAEHILNTVNDTLTEFKEFDKTVNYKLAVGTTIYSAQTMFKQIEKFKKKHDDLRFNIWEADSTSLYKLLKERKIDVAYVNDELSDSDIKSKLILDENCFCILPKNIEEYIKHEEISIEELAKLPLILLTSNTFSGLYKQIIDTFNEKKLDANILCECHDSSILIQLLSRGVGGTVLPGSAITKDIHKSYTVLPIKDNYWTSQTQIAWRKDGYTSKIAQVFINENIIL
ncbi:LysR family transcriptional regulator [Staphylococcus shinii]|uniref:LysR family transcriptional regulator n=1 Tax=Staphylococcus shinii TaxID=2912228 RepID=UPI003F55ADDD